MLSTGYNCRDVLNIGLMRPIFSPTEYIQIKGRGTRLLHLQDRHTPSTRRRTFSSSISALSLNTSRKNTTTPLPLEAATRDAQKPQPTPPGGGAAGPAAGDPNVTSDTSPADTAAHASIPRWEGHDTLVSREVIEVGPNGEKVDVMTFRGSFERDVKNFAEQDPEMKTARR